MIRLWLITLASLPCLTYSQPTQPVQVQSEVVMTMLADVKVPVQLGVMSRCPDALLCESVFNSVLPAVTGKIDLSLVYVARIDPEDERFGVSCLHGPLECAGNIQQLCVAKHATFQQWWDFVQCQNFNGRSHIGQHSLALRCAKSSGFDWSQSGVAGCADEDARGPAPEGVELLKQSLQLGQELGIRKSCTVLINRKPVCIHDETWKECEGGHEVNDFVKQIEDEYTRLNGLN